MSAERHETRAGKDNRCYAVNLEEFAKGIDDDNLFRTCCLVLTKVGPQLTVEAALFNHGDNSRRSIDMPRNNDQKDVRKFGKDFFIYIQDHFLFAMTRVACHKNRLGTLKIQEPAYISFYCRVSAGAEQIIFGVAVYMDSGRVCAHGFDAVGILFSDHTEDIEIHQHLPKKRTQPEIRGDRSRRYPSVNQGGLYAHPV